MPALRRLLEQSAFGPQEIKRMTDAYEIALALLGLVDRSDPITQTLARRVINAAQTGEENPNRIASLAIEELRA